MSLNIGKRHIMALLSFLGFVNLYLMRSNIGVALVAMVKNSQPKHLPRPANMSEFTPASSFNESTYYDITEGCYELNFNNSGNTYTGGDFDWDRKTQGAVLSSFFAGYVFTQIPGGYLATRYGPVRIIGVGIGVSAILTLLLPFGAYVSVYFVIVLRILLGFFEGCFLPATHVVWSRWAPPRERTKLVAFAFSGTHIGIVTAMFMSGLISHTLGWQWVFYLCGISALLWTAAWLAFAYDSPAHPKAGVSPKELAYILDTVLTEDESQADKSGLNPEDASFHRNASTTASTAPIINEVEVIKEQAKCNAAAASASEKAKPSPPWLKFAKSPAVWAISLAHVSHTWFFYTLMTQMAIFINDELHLPLIQNGLLSAAPFLSFFIGQVTSSQFCDWLRTSKNISVTVLRKSFFGVGAVLASVSLFAVSFVGCSATWISIFICFSAITAGWTVCGFYMNHIDIAPQYAGILMGISNMLATFSGIISPSVTGMLTTNSANGPPSVVESEWRRVFGLAAVIHIIGAIIFVVFGSGRLQEWAKENKEVEDENRSKPASVKFVIVPEEEYSPSAGTSSIQLKQVATHPQPETLEQ